MKRKVRTISLNNQKFAWWYNISEHVTIVKISPLHDKTSIIRIKFPDIVCSDYWGTYNESVVISKDDTQYCVKIVEPKMAGLLLSYFIARNDLFVTRKTIELNGYDVLLQMGYQIVKVKNGVYW